MFLLGHFIRLDFWTVVKIISKSLMWGKGLRSSILTWIRSLAASFLTTAVQISLHGFEFLLCNFELVWSQKERLGLCVWCLLWWSASPRDLAGMIGRDINSGKFHEDDCQDSENVTRLESTNGSWYFPDNLMLGSRISGGSLFGDEVGGMVLLLVGDACVLT